MKNEDISVYKYMKTLCSSTLGIQNTVTSSSFMMIIPSISLGLQALPFIQGVSTLQTLFSLAQNGNLCLEMQYIGQDLPLSREQGSQQSVMKEKDKYLEL